jgi:hypothetical protein
VDDGARTFTVLPSEIAANAADEPREGVQPRAGADRCAVEII